MKQITYLLWAMELYKVLMIRHYMQKKYSQNFTAVNKKFVLSLHYNGDDSYLFVNDKQELKFKAKDDQIVKEILCLGNISDDWTTAMLKKRGFGVKYMILLLIILVLILVIYITFIDI